MSFIACLQQYITDRPVLCSSWSLPDPLLGSSYNQYGIPVVFYDQVGNGRSTHFAECRGDANFWTEELFRNELPKLLSALGISDRPYDILGKSWGGMVGSAFATYRPKNLRRLIISNSPASMQLWIQSCNHLRAQLPKEVQAVLTRNEKAGTVDIKEYAAATQVFYNRHLCRIPFPKLLQQSLGWISRDNTVYRAMNSPSEFYVTGSLKTWSIIDRLHLINVPTLVINGQYDEAQDIVIWPFLEEKRSKTSDGSRIQNASHMSHLERPSRYLKIVAQFLHPYGY
ncbi:MAG: hypothetical protein M1816_006449 [Peltula sp. TS41687]|nr:MAG: hypothetical protein M1816_006449 [Peltula sp. TS41687]